MKPSLLTLAAIPVALYAASLPSSAQKKKVPPMAKPIGLIGVVAGQPENGEFFLRSNAQTYRVKPLPKVDMKSVKGGDKVRVWGRPTGLRVNYANVRILEKRASDNPNDYDPSRVDPIIKEG